MKMRVDALFDLWCGVSPQCGQLVVYSATPVDDDRRAEILRQFASAYTSLVLAHGPARPSLGKWTPTFLCLNWWVLALSGGILGPLVREALSSVKDEETVASLQDAAEGFQLDVNWAAVQAKGKRVFLMSVESVDWQVRTLIFGILAEPLHHLAKFYMAASRANLYKSSSGWPPMLELMNERKSLIFALLQYYSSLLDSRAGAQWNTRLVFVQVAQRCATREEWQIRFAGDLQLLRSGCLMIIGALERR